MTNTKQFTSNGSWAIHFCKTVLWCINICLGALVPRASAQKELFPCLDGPMAPGPQLGWRTVTVLLPVLVKLAHRLNKHPFPHTEVFQGLSLRMRTCVPPSARGSCT